MDTSSLIGLALALIAVLGTQAIEGGALSLYLQPAAFLIVVLGTLSAVVMQNPWPTLKHGFRMTRWLLHPPDDDIDGAISRIKRWSQIARQEGPLALEKYISQVHDPYIKGGLQMVLDGTDPAHLSEAMEIDIDAFEERELRACRIWESAGGYAPTMGILGAVMGLVHVMQNLTDPSKIGIGIAVAFVATIYGVGLANLIFLPIYHKLRNVVSHRVRHREMIRDGMVSMARGDNPRLTEQRLKYYF